MDRPIKILFLTANPKDTSQLRLDEEMRGIDQVLRQSEFRDRFDIKQQWAVRVVDLQGYLLRHKPDIVHFSGHGSASSEIILEDNNGNSQPVSNRALSQLFSVLKDNIRCVILNACYSEQQAQAIAKHIDCVIGMSKAIGDSAAISFAIAFYQALGYNRDIKTAFDLGCVEIDLESLNEQDTPKLLAINSNPHEIVFVHGVSPSSNYRETDKSAYLKNLEPMSHEDNRLDIMQSAKTVVPKLPPVPIERHNQIGRRILRPNQVVRTETSGMDCIVEQFIGGGGQGEVYRTKLAGKTVALKWYFRASASTEQRERLEEFIKKGAPNDSFFGPLEMASAEDVEGFGFIMPFREPRYRGIIDLIARRIEPTFRALATAGFQLSENFLQLHLKGFCYRDISYGNVFFDPANGDVLIADMDNIKKVGDTEHGVLSTPRFIAPEVVRGEALPSIQTDLFSLAVLLFYMFMMSHPLDGEKEVAIKSLDLPAMAKLYGSDPVFIFDPNDDSNRPVPGHHDNAISFWPIYPQFLRYRFTQAFTDGIRDPQNGRIREVIWKADMVKLRDAIFYCSHCKYENFYDADTLQASGSKPAPCWSCKKEPLRPARIQIGSNIVMLNYDTALFPHHIDDQKMFDFSRPIAAVTQHPKNPTVWGLKNVSSEKWVITTADGKLQEIEPHLSVSLANGVKINFGKTEGEILFY